VGDSQQQQQQQQQRQNSNSNTEGWQAISILCAPDMPA
jgi:hypothetical protein